MYINLEEEEENVYHYCVECLKENGNEEALKNEDLIKDKRRDAPAKSKICDECSSFAEEGSCKPIFLESR